MKRLAAFVLLLAGMILIVYAVFNKPHEFGENECRDCHTDQLNDPGSITGSITDICLRCHSRAIIASSHPVDIRPVGVSVPADLPLQRGMITCSTCHNIHAKRSNAFGEKTYFLRRPSAGRDFCMSCHKQSPSIEIHSDALGVAHIGGRFKLTDPSEPLDPVSTECIGCHDGVGGKMAEFQFGEGAWTHYNPDHSHPIGVSHERSRMAAENLRPVAVIDKRIKFFDGKIGCGTCHDIYSKSKSLLVMSNKGSKLCTECHEL